MDYQSNAKKQKADRPPKEKIEAIVTGEVIQKPKSVGHKFKDIFFGGDFKLAVRYVSAEVLLPAFRNLIVDAVTKGAERMVFGESYRRTPEFRSFTQYNNPLARRDMRDPRTARANLPDQPSRFNNNQRRDANDIILSSREEAELVVERLIDIIDKYDVASLADLHELLGIPTSHVDNKWGWTYLNNVEIRQVRSGYLIDLPTLEEI